MGDEDLEEIRRRRMDELMRTQARAAQETEARKELEEKKQSVLRQILTAEARERLNSIKMARPDFADQVEAQLIALAQSGRLKSTIDDEQMKGILRQLTPRKREFRIRRI
jgi:programmed cell death protein 5